MGFSQQRQIDSKTPVGSLRARYRLKYQVDRHALIYQTQRRRHMSEHTALRRNAQPRDDLVQQAHQSADDGRIVAGGVDADAGIARSEHDAVEDRSGNALLVIEGTTGVQPDTSAPARP